MSKDTEKGLLQHMIEGLEKLRDKKNNIKHLFLYSAIIALSAVILGLGTAIALASVSKVLAGVVGGLLASGAVIGGSRYVSLHNAKKVGKISSDRTALQNLEYRIGTKPILSIYEGCAGKPEGQVVIDSIQSLRKSGLLSDMFKKLALKVEGELCGVNNNQEVKCTM